MIYNFSYFELTYRGELYFILINNKLQTTATDYKKKNKKKALSTYNKTPSPTVMVKVSLCC